MKQSLQLKIGQQLTMTPQLQQAIKLLQLSTLDLQQEIQQALESNPMLDVNEEQEAERKADSEQEKVKTEEVDFSNNVEAKTETVEVEGPNADSEWQENIPEDLPVDTQWDDVYQSSTPSTPNSSQATSSNEDFDFDSRNSVTESLQDHLLWQLNLTRMSDIDRSIAMAIIDAVDDNGRLTLSAEQLHNSFIKDNPDIELDEVVAVLRLNDVGRALSILNRPGGTA